MAKQVATFSASRDKDRGTDKGETDDKPTTEGHDI
jgi:hypothetical protein